MNILIDNQSLTDFCDAIRSGLRGKSGMLAGNKLVVGTKRKYRMRFEKEANKRTMGMNTSGDLKKSRASNAKRRRSDAEELRKGINPGMSRQFKKEFAKGSKAMKELEKLPKNLTTEWRAIHGSLATPDPIRLSRVARLERVKQKRRFRSDFGASAAKKQQGLMTSRERARSKRMSWGMV